MELDSGYYWVKPVGYTEWVIAEWDSEEKLFFNRKFPEGVKNAFVFNPDDADIHLPDEIADSPIMDIAENYFKSRARSICDHNELHEFKHEDTGEMFDIDHLVLDRL